jgi:hypothetical protein
MFVSPRGYLVRALLIAVAFALVHALGWRQETRFLSGTPAAVVPGLIYLCLYFAFVLGAPALVLGAGIFAVMERRARG